MADVKISQLPAATLPLTGTEIFPLVQSGVTVQTALNTIQSPIAVNVKDYGAKGDGTTNDIAAFVAALNTGLDVVVPDGTYLLSPAVAQEIPNNGSQRLFGSGNATLSINLASSINVFNFSGAVSFENLTIDFNNSYARYAFFWRANAGHIQLKNITVQNLKDIDSNTGSITFFIISTGNTFTISDITGTSLLKRGNGSITDANGSYNMIYVGNGTGPTQGSIQNIYVSEIHNIDASDNIIYEDTSAVYVSTDANDQLNRIQVSNIKGYNFGKRLIKIDASNVSIYDVEGYSISGDSLGVIGFLSGAGTGDKYGCSATNVRAYGLMEVAFASTAIDTVWRNVIASVQPGTKPGMSTASVGLFISSDGTIVDGYWSDSQRDIGIGSPTQIIKNTTLRNIFTVINSTKTSGSTIYNLSFTLGFDGLLIDNLQSVVTSTGIGTGPIHLYDYLNGTTKIGQNLTINNVLIETQGPLNSQGINVRYTDNISISNVKYINTSGFSHFRIIELASSSNVRVDDVHIEGACQSGVALITLTGKNVVSRADASGATLGVVTNSSVADLIVSNCTGTVLTVTPITYPSYQNAKITFGTTANRPTANLVAYITQYYDTTLGKPIWWNGSAWKDATGTTV